MKFLETSYKYDICPDCGKRSLRAKELYEGGAVGEYYPNVIGGVWK